MRITSPAYLVQGMLGVEEGDSVLRCGGGGGGLCVSFRLLEATQFYLFVSKRRLYKICPKLRTEKKHPVFSSYALTGQHAEIRGKFAAYCGHCRKIIKKKMIFFQLSKAPSASPPTYEKSTSR